MNQEQKPEYMSGNTLDRLTFNSFALGVGSFWVFVALGLACIRFRNEYELPVPGWTIWLLVISLICMFASLILWRFVSVAKERNRNAEERQKERQTMLQLEKTLSNMQNCKTSPSSLTPEKQKSFSDYFVLNAAVSTCAYSTESFVRSVMSPGVAERIFSFPLEDVRFALAVLVRLLDGDSDHLDIFTDYAFYGKAYTDIAGERDMSVDECREVLDYYSDSIRQHALFLSEVLHQGLIPLLTQRLSEYASQKQQGQPASTTADTLSVSPDDSFLTENALVRCLLLSSPRLDTSIRDIPFSKRLWNALVRGGFTQETTLQELLSNPSNDIRKIRNLGKHSFDELVDTFYLYGATKEQVTRFLTSTAYTKDDSLVPPSDPYSDQLKIGLKDAGVSTRLLNCLIRDGFLETTPLRELMNEPCERFMNIRNFGKQSLDELASVFSRYGATESQISFFLSPGR